MSSNGAAPVRNSVFMPHINGLRALAIVLVVLYHLDAALCPCGYFGVDVFLVISGYFIFSKELRPERVAELRYGSYLLRKVWRVGPPALVLCVAVLACGSFVLLREVYHMATQTVLYCCVGGSNEYVAHSGDYFNPDTQNNPLMHLWYIGLIIQLYILLPLAAMAVRRLSVTMRGLLWWCLGLASLVLYLFLRYGEAIEGAVVAVRTLGNVVSPYYSVLTRLWEPMAAMLVLLVPVLPARYRFMRGAAALLGLLLVVGSCYAYGTGSGASFCAVAGSILLLQYGASGPVGALLGMRPVQWVGSISFSLYLTHWPVFAIWKYVSFDHMSPADQWAAALVSVLLAMALWWGVEKRCGGWLKGMSRRAVAWCTAAIPMLLMVVAAAVTWYKPVGYLLPNAWSEHEQSFDMPIALHSFNMPESDVGCFPSDVFSSTPLGIGNDTTQPISFVLMGDSHSWHLFYGLDRLLSERGGLRGLYLNNSCVPAWNTFLLLSGGDSKWDRARGEGMMRWLAEQKNIRSVVISAYWHLRFDDTDIRDWDLRSIPPAQARWHQEQGLRKTCRRLKAMGKQVVIVSDSPFYPYEENHVERFSRYYLLGKDYPLPPAMTPAQFAAKTEQEANFLRSLQEEGLAMVIDPCPALAEDGCYPIRLKDGRFLYQDTNHLSAHGSVLVSELILQQAAHLLQPQK